MNVFIDENQCLGIDISRSSEINDPFTYIRDKQIVLLV